MNFELIALGVLPGNVTAQVVRDVSEALGDAYRAGRNQVLEDRRLFDCDICGQILKASLRHDGPGDPVCINCVAEIKRCETGGDE